MDTKYSFDHILSYEQWKQLNDDIVSNTISTVTKSRLCDDYYQEIYGDFYAFLEEKKLRVGYSIENINSDVFRHLSREDKRTYRTYKYIIDNCIWDNSQESDEYNQDSISYSLLALWEEKDKMYNQTILAHCYYLSLFCEHIAAMRTLYVKMKKQEREKAKKQNRKPRTETFSEWYDKHMTT